MSAKDIRVEPISSQDARRIIKSIHYSGKVTSNAQLHFGVFIGGKCGGAMSFGPSMDKSKLVGVVRGTKWNGFIELNRMAFSDALPRNSESRALSVALRIIKKNYPHIEWVVSFADACQCGDGTIYRAAGFDLTGITKNKSIYKFPTGDVLTGISLESQWNGEDMQRICRALKIPCEYRTRKQWEAFGAKPLAGFQIRYMYFLNPEARNRLTVPILPFSTLDDAGARMYKGKKL